MNMERKNKNKKKKVQRVITATGGNGELVCLVCYVAYL